MSLLQVSGIGVKDERNFELKQISFTQQRLQKIAIAGETGSGKSTLLKIIAGFVQPDAGEVWLEGERVKGPYEQLIAGHPKIVYSRIVREIQYTQSCAGSGFSRLGSSFGE